MAQNDTDFQWNDKRAKAAQLLADGRLSDEEIALSIEGSRSQLARWKRHPEFQARVDQIVEETAERLKKQGIRLKENRLAQYQRIVDKMTALIEARGEEMGRTGEIAGGETGLLVRDYKGKDAETAVYAFDASLVRELREHAKQAAVEVGEWTEQTKTEINLQPSGVTIEIDDHRKQTKHEVQTAREAGPSVPEHGE